VEHDDVAVPRAFGDVVEAAGARRVAVRDLQGGGARGARGDADDRGRGAEGRGAGRQHGAGGAQAASSLLGRPASGAVQTNSVEVRGPEGPFGGGVGGGARHAALQKSGGRSSPSCRAARGGGASQLPPAVVT